jgi:hypothetical protein
MSSTTDIVSKRTQLRLIVVLEITLFGLGLSPPRTPPIGPLDYMSGSATKTQSSADLKSSIEHRVKLIVYNVHYFCLDSQLQFRSRLSVDGRLSV